MPTGQTRRSMVGDVMPPVSRPLHARGCRDHMNKAFTKESDDQDDEGDDLLEDAPRPGRPKGTEHITPEGFRALEAELKNLWGSVGGNHR